LRIIGGQRHEDADLPHPIRLLRVRGHAAALPTK
jgi:hypothetical protein